VTRGLVKHQALVDALFDYEEASVGLSNGSNGDLGQVGSGHAPNYK
jgi:hypothetical protein